MDAQESLKTWCRRLQASDREAFEHVFRALHDALLRYASRVTGSRAAACDVVQDAFLELWDMRERLDPERSLKALLYRMVRNRAYNDRRHHRVRASKHRLLREKRASTYDGTDLPDVVMNGHALQEKLWTWIDELPERQREALVLSRFENLSHGEVAATMEISPHTVNNHIVRALKTLRDRIYAFEPGLLQQ